MSACSTRAAYPPVHTHDRPAVFIVSEFAPKATAPAGNSRCGCRDTACTVSTIVPPQARCSVFKEIDNRCLKRIVVCDMPAHKARLAVPPSGTAASCTTRTTKRPRRTGAFFTKPESTRSRLCARGQGLIAQIPKRGRSPFLIEMRALFIRKLSTIARSWPKRPFEEATPMEAVLDIGEPFEEGKLGGISSPRQAHRMYTRCQTQRMISHSSIRFIASQHRTFGATKCPRFCTQDQRLTGNWKPLKKGRRDAPALHCRCVRDAYSAASTFRGGDTAPEL